MLRRGDFRFEFPLGLLGRVPLGYQIGRFGIDEGGLHAVGLSDGRWALQNVVLGAQQLLKSLVAPVALDVRHITGRSRGVSFLLIVLLRWFILLARQIQLRIKIETQPLSEQRDTLLGAGGHRGDQLIGI